jgi:hypothetical protein
MSDILVDASFLVTMGYPRDRNHQSARKFAIQRGSDLLIPDVVIPEVFYNLRRLGGTIAALRFGELLSQEQPRFAVLAPTDFNRAINIMRVYLDADLDIVDCCLTAMAERLNITEICTFDRRDFSMIRPQHVAYFAILPM